MPIPIRVLIVDDERLARLGVRRELEAVDGAEIVGECASGGAAVRAIEDLRPDLVFLDIRMPGIDGIEVVRRVSPDAMPLVIFVTAYDRYAVEAFEVEAVDYLVKPLDPQRFHEAFRRARRRLREGTVGEIRERLDHLLARMDAGGDSTPAGATAGRKPLARIAVEEGGRTRLIDVARIEWIGSEGNYVRLHLDDGESHLIRRTLKSLERDLDSTRFLRISRSTIVNTGHLAFAERRDGERHAFRMESGTELVSARRYCAAINAFLREYR